MLTRQNAIADHASNSGFTHTQRFSRLFECRLATLATFALSIWCDFLVMTQ